jgi:hypothetical protein
MSHRLHQLGTDPETKAEILANKITAALALCDQPETADSSPADNIRRLCDEIRGLRAQGIEVICGNKQIFLPYYRLLSDAIYAEAKAKVTILTTGMQAGDKLLLFKRPPKDPRTEKPSLPVAALVMKCIPKDFTVFVSDIPRVSLCKILLDKGCSTSLMELAAFLQADLPDRYNGMFNQLLEAFPKEQRRQVVKTVYQQKLKLSRDRGFSTKIRDNAAKTAEHLAARLEAMSRPKRPNHLFKILSAIGNSLKAGPHSHTAR